MRSCCPFVSFSWLIKWFHRSEKLRGDDPRRPLLNSPANQPTENANYGITSTQFDATQGSQTHALPRFSESPSNDKVNLFVKAVEQRRPICFVPSLDNTMHQAFIDGSAESSLKPNRELVQRIVPASVNFQRVMNEGAPRARTRCPCPEGGVSSTSNTESGDDPTQKTEEVKSDSEDSVTASEIRQSLPESLTEEHLANIQATLLKGSLDDQIGNWLSRIVPPPVEETSLYFRRSNAELSFWHDENTDGPSNNAFGRALFSNALIDAANLRRPGYLQYNSFAEQHHVQANSHHKSGTKDEEETNSSSSEASMMRLNNPVHEQSRGEAQHFVHAPCPLEGHAALRTMSAFPSKASTPLPLALLRDSPLDRVIQQAQFELTRMRLEGYLVTDTSSESTMP